MSKPKKDKRRIKVRNWLAVHAHFRRSGRMDDNERKKNSKTACRKWKHNKESDSGSE